MPSRVGSGLPACLIVGIIPDNFGGWPIILFARGKVELTYKISNDKWKLERGSMFWMMRTAAVAAVAAAVAP